MSNSPEDQISDFLSRTDPVPQTSQEYMQLWMAFRNLGEHAEADSRLTPYAATIAAGNRFRMMGEVENALTQYARAVVLRPELPFAYARMADLLSAMHRFREAAHALTQAAERGNWIDRLLRMDDALYLQVQAHAIEHLAGPSLEGRLRPANQRAVLYVCCDPVYCNSFLVGLVRSFLLHGNLNALIHIHIVNPNQTIEPTMAEVTKIAGASAIACTFEHTDLSNLNETQHKTYYACARFLNLPQLLEHYDCPIIVVDADILVVHSVSELLDAAQQVDVRLLSLDPIRCDSWARFSASVLIFNQTTAARGFAARVRAWILYWIDQQVMTWFLDQIAIHAIYAQTQLREEKIAFSFIPTPFLEYCSPAQAHAEPKPETVFWSVTASIEQNWTKLESAVYRRYSLP